MPLPSGSKIGPYEILSAIGAGGMGEVYRATDPRLNRVVALKILPQESKTDPDRERRFQQEARAASALNHPNILSVFDIGTESGTHYIVSEIIEGESLRAMLQRGPIGIKKLLDLATQIADGLAAAHQAGIVHRDLKPENIMVTNTGRIKLLDFGLAKAASGPAQQDASSYKTATSTEPGLILGTVPYMSPEQARGEMATFHSDQFSFGSILYEMATGKKAFHRETAVQTLSAIIADEPAPISTLNPKIAAPVRWVVERCIAKEPSDRYGATVDLFHELRNLRDHISDSTFSESTVVAKPAKSYRSIIVMSLIAIGCLAAGFLISSLRSHRAMDLSSYQFTPFATDAEPEGQAAWSPDGKSIAYAREVKGVAQIFTHSLNSQIASQVTNSTEHCFQPLWSPDGSRIFYFSNGPNERLSGRSMLWSIGSAGGAPEMIQKNTVAATFSPDGKALATIRDDGGGEAARLWISSPPSSKGEPYKVEPFESQKIRGAYIQFSPDGKTLGVWVAPWDTQNFDFWILPYPHGTPYKAKISLLNDLQNPGGANIFRWMPDNRTIVFPGELKNSIRLRLWAADTKNGSSHPMTATYGVEDDPAVSPDGKTIAFTVEQTQLDLIEVPLDGSPPQDLLATSQDEFWPSWAPDGTQFAYIAIRTGEVEIWLKSTQQGWERPIVTPNDFSDHASDFDNLHFSPDGQKIAYQNGFGGEYAIWISNLAGGPPYKLAPGDHYQDAPEWSPDAQWLVYIYRNGNQFNLAKSKLGSSEKKVVLKENIVRYQPAWSPKNDWIAYTDHEGLSLISVDGKTSELLTKDEIFTYGWSKDGNTLYGIRLAPDKKHVLIAIDIATKQTKQMETLPAFQGYGAFSLSPDGKSFATTVYRGGSDIWLLTGFAKNP